MHYCRILVPFDGSDHSQAAFTTARELALTSEDTELYVVNVVPMALAPSPSESDPFTGAPSTAPAQADRTEEAESPLLSIKKEIEDIVDPLLDGLPTQRVHVEVITYPSPVHGLVDYANNHGCDLIVMGRRGLGAIRGLLGSVSYGILHNVDIPVLTVK